MGNDTTGVSKVFILETSKSKKSLVLDIGHLDGAYEGQEAFIVMQSIPGLDKRLVIAKARLTKVFPDKSYWYMQKIYRDQELDLLEKNVEVTLLKDTPLNRGDRKLTSKTRRLIVDNKKYSNEVIGTAIPKKHIQKKAIKLEIDGNTTILKSEPDVEILKIQTWNNEGKVVVTEKTALKGDVTSKDLGATNNSDKIRYHNEEKAFHGKYIKKTKKSDGQLLVKQHQDNTKENRAHNFLTKEQLTTSNKSASVDEKYDYGEEDNKLIRAKGKRIFRSIKNRKKDAWSDELDDRQLELYITKQGLEFERKRQRIIGNRKGHQEVSGYFALNLTDNSSKEDQSTDNTMNFSGNFGYEYYLHQQSNFLERWSVEASLRRSKDVYDVNGKNATIDELSFMGALFWYPFQYPRNINQALFFFGLGYRYGLAGLSTENGNLESGYSLWSFPVFHTGLKYRFLSGWGIKGLITVAQQNLNLKDSQLSGQLPVSIQVLESRFGIGVTYYW